MKLSELTDSGYTPEDVIVPEARPLPTDIRRVIIDTSDPILSAGTADIRKPENTFWSNVGMAGVEDKTGSSEHPVIKKLFGLGGEERYQLWPEKIVREGLSAAGDVMSGKVPTWSIDPETGELTTSSNMVEKAQAISALAGTGGLMGTTDATLGATPFLRPALKHKDKLYKGKPGQEHQDIIPKELYDDFSRKAMAGEDLAEYNFGFMNDKGHFLTREKALEYGIANGIIDPHAGKFGTLTSTMFADSSKPGVAIEAMAKSAQPFYSAVEHTVKNIPQGKMTGDQWLGTLANKPGVKPEELDWIGLKDFLAENKGKPVTKQQVEDFIAQNKVELKEVNKGGPVELAGYEVVQHPTGQGFALRDQQGNYKLAPEDYRNPGSVLKWETEELAKNAGMPVYNEKHPTKYHSYQLPGGENYREMLLTLPASKTDADFIKAYAKHTGMSPDDPILANAKPEEIARLRKQTEGLIGDNYKSSHWDEPNIIAHIRMNDRAIDDKKSLHFEEIQSDWHQQGRDRGYKGGEKETPYIKPDDLKIKEGQYDWSVTTPSGKEVKVGKGVTKTEDEAREYLVRYINKGIAEANSNMRIAESDKLPDAPFKKSWHELALKRMIREAAEKGYDRLSWTPGEAQAARYDLSKQVQDIRWNKQTQGNDTIVRINPNDGKTISLQMNKDGKIVESHPRSQASQFEGKNLSDVVGKDLAKSIMAKESGELKGEGLKIGGEGMKGFYDQIIPKALEKIGKEHGVKVQKGNIAGNSKAEAHNWDIGTNHVPPRKIYEALPRLREEYSTIAKFVDHYNGLKDAARAKLIEEAKQHSAKGGSTPVFYIDIPQSLKNTALGRGFPLFSSVHPGYTFVPYNGNPFEDNK